MGAFFGVSVSPGHGILASMLHAALPQEEGEGRGDDTYGEPNFGVMFGLGLGYTNTPQSSQQSWIPYDLNFNQRQHSTRPFMGKRSATRPSKAQEAQTRGLRGMDLSKSRWETKPRSKTPHLESKSSKPSRPTNAGARKQSLKVRGRPKQMGKLENDLTGTSWLQRAKEKLKGKMFSSSTRATRASKRKKMQDIMDDNCISFGKDGLEADDLLTIGAVLDEMDIKTGDQYLGEVKLMQLELGIAWPDTLDRQLAMVKRALRRDKGPEVRAKEVKLADITNETWEKINSKRLEPMRTAWCYAWATLCRGSC